MPHRLTLMAIAALALPGLAAAQTAPSRIAPPTRPDQTPTPARPLQEPVATPRAEQAPPTIQPFVLRGVRIEGSTLPPALLAAKYQPFIGRSLDGSSLIQISDAVASAYQGSGVALYTVAIPEQDFADGVVQLVAREGYIESVAIDGPRGRRQRELIAAYVGKLRAEKPLRQATLQRYVSLIRDIPGLTVDLQLQAGEQPGGVKLAIRARPNRVQAGIGINNRGTAFLGRTQVQADLLFNSAFRQGDQTQFTVAAPTEPKLFQYYAAAHSQPIGANGTRVQVSAGYLRTRPLAAGLRGHATSAGVQLTHPLIRSFDKDLYVTVGFDGANSDNAFFGFTFSDDRTRVARGSLAFNASTRKSLFAISAALSQGVSGLGARTLDPAVSELDFTKVNGRVAYNRSLGGPVIVRLTAAGQYSGDRLPGAEQFALGGDEFGRAYQASLIAGDYGYAGAAELALRPQKLPAALAGSELYGFVDGGKVWYRGRNGFSTQSADLGSAGGGARIALKSRVVVQLEAVRGLADPLAFADGRDWRGVFSVRSAF